jgi:hypothetical protein
VLRRSPSVFLAFLVLAILVSADVATVKKYYKSAGPHHCSHCRDCISLGTAAYCGSAEEAPKLG